MKKIILTAILLFGVFMSKGVYSQDKKMMMPTPAILQKVLDWEGEWEANLTMNMGGKTATGVDHIKWSKASDGKAATGMQWMDSPMGGKYYASHLVGYNMEDKHLHWFVVDNMGQCQESWAEMAGDNHIRLKYSGKKDGKPISSTVDLMIKDQNTVDFKSVLMEGGKTTETSMGTYKRH